MKKHKNERRSHRGKGGSCRLGFWKTRTDGQKATIALVAIAAIMALIISVWVFFFKYNISLIYQGQDREKLEASSERKDKLEEIKDKFRSAFDDFGKSFNEAKEKRIERQTIGREKAEEFLPEEGVPSEEGKTQDQGQNPEVEEAQE